MSDFFKTYILNRYSVNGDKWCKCIKLNGVDIIVDRSYQYRSLRKLVRENESRYTVGEVSRVIYRRYYDLLPILVEGRNQRLATKAEFDRIIEELNLLNSNGKE